MIFKIETFVFVWNWNNCICENGITNISIFVELKELRDVLQIANIANVTWITLGGLGGVKK